MMKAIKYEGAESLAVKLGKEMGDRVFRDHGDPDFTHFAVIPMHSSKVRKRGIIRHFDWQKELRRYLVASSSPTYFCNPRDPFHRPKKPRGPFEIIGK